MTTTHATRYPFPVRPGFVASLTLPHDMTEAEAERVAAYVKSLALPALPDLTGDDQ